MRVKKHALLPCSSCLQAQMVKPGDASMASPFTAKQGHIMPCTDILKQGRSTLVTTVQMFKILGLLCLSTAYSLSVMYLQVRHDCNCESLTLTGSGIVCGRTVFFCITLNPVHAAEH